MGKKIISVLKGIGYYIVSFTWGILMSTAGLLVALAMLVSGHRPHRFHYCIYFVVGENWGGASMGTVILVSKSAYLSTYRHEHGHSIQNLMLGPLMPFVVCIPSAIRYWLREMPTDAKKELFCTLLIYALLFVGITIGMVNVFCLTGVVSTVCSIIGISIDLYTCVLWVWLDFIECPKYSHTSYVPYDDVWFEGTATALGNKYFGDEVRSTITPTK